MPFPSPEWSEAAAMGEEESECDVEAGMVRRIVMREAGKMRVHYVRAAGGLVRGGDERENMTGETGFHDAHGIPIHVGDLIRVKHYRHYLRKRQMWLYFRVACIGGRFVVQNWSDLRPDAHQCLLEHCGLDSAEVLAESVLIRNSRGEIQTFNERKRKRP